MKILNPIKLLLVLTMLHFAGYHHGGGGSHGDTVHYHLCAAGCYAVCVAAPEEFVGGFGPLQYVKPVFPAHLCMVSLAHPVPVEVGQQDVEVHLLVVQIAYHQHAHGIICISVYDDCCFWGGVGGGNVECV